MNPSRNANSWRKSHKSDYCLGFCAKRATVQGVANDPTSCWSSSIHVFVFKKFLVFLHFSFVFVFLYFLYRCRKRSSKWPDLFAFFHLFIILFLMMIPKGLFSDIYLRVLSSMRPCEALTIKDKKKRIETTKLSLSCKHLLPFNSAKNWYWADPPIPGSQVIENRLLVWKWKERPKIIK